MISAQCDVIVVGAGCAGLSAALGLARAGFSVVVLEAGAAPGAANPFGSVYFTESLAEPELLGPSGVEALAWERRLVERGLFASDGHGLFGATYRDPDAFRHSYTVLRPRFDPSLAQAAERAGATLLTGISVESLIREEGRVIGVCTAHGPLYAHLVFLAEGDAAHLVTREGYERSSDPRDAPRYLLGISQVIELPPGAIEERFGVGAGEGVAHQIFVRNATRRGRPLHLNLRAFVQTNRTSLSVSLLLPVEHLHQHFECTPGLLLDWFLGLPALEPWLRDGKLGLAGAKVLRGGGARDVPHLVEEGLAIGGAAAGLGVSYPFLNHTGPATASGLLLARAATAIRAEGGGFRREQLRRHYLEPLHQTHYWKDLRFLRRWPGYVRKTQLLFDDTLDFVLGAAHVWTRPRWLPGRLFQWMRLLRLSSVSSRWRDLVLDLERLGWSLHLRTVAGRPALGRLFLDGAVNALRDLVGRRRPNLPEAGSLRLHYHTAGPEKHGPLPGSLRRWLRRFTPVLGAATRILWRNDSVPLADRMPAAVGLLVRQFNLLDLIGAAVFGLFSVFFTLVGAGLGKLRLRLGRPPRVPAGVYAEYAAAARAASDLTPLPEPGPGRERLARLVRRPADTSFVHVLWPRSLGERETERQQELTPLCPTGVFESQADRLGNPRLLVHFDRCIQCEACWRADPSVSWGRDDRQLVGPPLAAAPVEASWPAFRDPWQAFIDHLAQQAGSTGERQEPGEQARLEATLDRLEGKLREFDRALAEPPATIDRARAQYLEMLARYAQQLASALVDRLDGMGWCKSGRAAVAAVSQPMRTLAGAVAIWAEERARRTWDGRFAWAAADGRRLLAHHLAGLRRLAHLIAPEARKTPAPSPPVPSGRLASAAALAERLTREAIALVLRSVYLPGLFQDEAGLDAIGKFGHVKRLVAEIAARRYLLQTVAGGLPALDDPETEALRGDLLAALAEEVLGQRPGSAAGNGRQILHLAGVGERAPLAQVVASALGWRGGALPSHAVFQRFGARWLVDAETLRQVTTLALDLETLVQRLALQAELAEVQRLETRGLALADEWLAHPVANAAARAEMAEALGRLLTYQLASKALLQRTHARLEEGLDVELEIPLLRVWLDAASSALDALTNVSRRFLHPADNFDERPLVEPGFDRPAASLTLFLNGPGPAAGDFLDQPVDLLQPRLVPEMVPPGPEEKTLARLLAETDFEEPLWVESAFEAAGFPGGEEVVPLFRRTLAVCTPVRLFEVLIELRRLAAVQPRGETDAGSGWIAWRRECLEEERFLAESMVFETLGLAFHARSRGRWLEWMLTRLLLGRLRERARLRAAEMGADGGPTGDEGGTMQAFFVLAELSRGQQDETEPLVPRHVGREALELEALKAAFRQQVSSARQLFGVGLWRNPSLQASSFLLAETAAWLKAADSTLGRLAWIVRMSQTEDTDESEPVLAPGRQALARCFLEIRERLHRFDEDLAQLRRGYYNPVIRAAVLLFQRRGEERGSGGLFPLFLDLGGCLVLVVGGGAVGRRKAAAALAAGARVRLICLEPRPPEETDRGLEWITAPYETAHLDGVTLVFAAAAPAVNDRVTADAHARGIWVNRASAPAAGDFFVPASVRQGDVVVAVSTGGVAPALAASVRQRLEQELDESFAAWAQLLAEVRPQILERIADPARRRALLEELCRWEWVERLRREGIDAVRAAMRMRIDAVGREGEA